MKRLLPLAVTTGGCLLVTAGALADEVRLRGGGELHGEVVQSATLPGEEYVVRTPEGIEVSLDRDQVADVDKHSAEEREYQRRSLRTPDTVEAQWELAEWCRQHGLVQQREIHLQRIIEIEPDHKGARRALGYQQTDGQWIQRDELMREQGYFRYQGRWRTQQEIDLLKQREKTEKAEAEWFGKLGLWRKWLGGRRADTAYANITAVTDPFAVPALIRAIEDEPNPAYRLLFIETLAQIESPGAMQALVERSVFDPDLEARETSIDALKRRKNAGTTGALLRLLRHKNNEVINRAAYALGRLEDSSAVGSLIDVLVTEHRMQVASGSPGQMSAGFGSAGAGGSSSSGGFGPGGLSFGNRPRTVVRQVRNAGVLDALVKLTGGINFDFDETAWRYWYAQQQRQGEIDARRDSGPAAN